MLKSRYTQVVQRVDIIIIIGLACFVIACFCPIFERPSPVEYHIADGTCLVKSDKRYNGLFWHEQSNAIIISDNRNGIPVHIDDRGAILNSSLCNGQNVPKITLIRRASLFSYITTGNNSNH